VKVKIRGSVSRFDAERGLGEITGEDGATYPFHSTVIADGSRTIAVGTAVEFEVTAGHLGRWQASEVVVA
jgi:cold shock CspA family protein